MLPDLFRALYFAAEWHSAQRRKGSGGEPYINHLVEVGFLLSDVGKIQDHEILIAGLLHDAIEDTTTSLNQITELFGVRVSQLVQAVSDDKSRPKAERKRLVLEHLVHAENAVKLIKLADLCSNINSVPRDWVPERIKDYFVWSRQVATLCTGVSAPLDQLFLSRWHSAATALGISP